MTVFAPEDQYNWRLNPRTGSIAVPGDLVARYAANAGEKHVVPSGSPYYIRSFLVPYVDDLVTYPIEVWTTADKSAGQLTRVGGAPAANQFWVDTSLNTALFEFNVAQAGTTVYIFYYGVGTPVCLPGIDPLYWGNVDDPSCFIGSSGIKPVICSYYGTGQYDMAAGTYRVDFDNKNIDHPGSDYVTTGAAWAFTNNDNYTMIVSVTVTIEWECKNALVAPGFWVLMSEIIDNGPGNNSASQKHIIPQWGVGNTLQQNVSKICVLDPTDTLYIQLTNGTGVNQYVNESDCFIEICSIGCYPKTS